MESYKEKYEQALEVAKETYNKQPMYREWLGKMFPELAESEDEKVRKELIDFTIKANNGVTSILANNYDFNKWLAWLEKQGKQKPTDEEMKRLLQTEYEKGRADVIAEMQGEWSEEDECYMTECINAIATKVNWSFEEKRKTKHWLESLRPQNRWKPSDEQMELLSEVQNALLGKDCHNRFTDFIWELKKLKEE